MNTDTKIIFGVLVATFLIIIFGISVFGRDNSPKRESLGTASMSIDKTFADLGTMKPDGEKTAIFTIKNNSDQILRIWNVATSCDCTFASVVINGVTNGEFNMPMHTNSTLKNWIGEIPSQQTALLNVVYRPKVMPVTGEVTRNVNFETNDPKNSKIEVTIKANVL